jgi:hypothetical protein
MRDREELKKGCVPVIQYYILYYIKGREQSSSPTKTLRRDEGRS